MEKKILFVINTLGRAGAEMALLELLKKFSGEEYSVDLYVLMGQGDLADRLPSHVRLRNRSFSKESVLSAKGRFHMWKKVCRSCFSRGTVFRLSPYLCKNAFRMLKNRRVQADKLLWRVLSDGADRFAEEYDLAVAFIEGGAAYYVAEHVKAKKKAAFIHIDYQMSGYTRELDRDCYTKFDRIFPISGETLNCFVKVYPECAERASVFHNIVDQSTVLEKAALPGGFEDDFDGIRLLTVARLNKQKAYPTAIEAMKRLKDAGVKARWYVLGDGEERKALEEKIAGLELQRDFLLLGAVDNPYPYFRQTDIYVHATAFEGMSIAIQEAQILGCKIVASDIISNRQQIRDGVDGLLCQLNPEAVADAIRSLIEDPAKAERMAAEASQRNVSHEEDMDLLLELLAQ